MQAGVYITFSIMGGIGMTIRSTGGWDNDQYAQYIPLYADARHSYILSHILFFYDINIVVLML